MDITNSSKMLMYNATTFQNEIGWLSHKINQRLTHFFENKEKTIKKIDPPNLNKDKSNYALFIDENCSDEAERLIVIFALASYFKPETFDRFLIKNKSLNQNFTEFGGRRNEKSGNSFIPTIRTIAFILFGDKISNHFEIQFYFWL